MRPELLRGNNAHADIDGRVYVTGAMVIGSEGVPEPLRSARFLRCPIADAMQPALEDLAGWYRAARDGVPFALVERPSSALLAAWDLMARTEADVDQARAAARERER